MTALQMSTEDRNFLYYGTNIGKVFKLQNANTTQYIVTEITSNVMPERGYVRSIAVDPRDHNTAMVAFSNYQVKSIFLTTDGGATFEDVSGNLEENPDGTGNGLSVRWVTIVPQTDDTNFYLAATSKASLYSTEALDGENTLWTLEDPNGIGNSVVNMIDYRRFDGKAAVATHGKGIYTSEIPNVAPYGAGLSSDDFQILSVNPNPFSDFVSVRISVPTSRFTIIRIYDTNGQLVRRISILLLLKERMNFFFGMVTMLQELRYQMVFIFSELLMEEEV